MIKCIINILLVLAFICYPTSVFALITTDFLDSEQIFEVPLAYPRSSGDIAFSINTSIYNKHRILYFEGVLGRNIPLVTMKSTKIPLQFQLGIEASTWVMLGYKGGAFPLLTEDFLMGVPLSFRYEQFSGALSYKHISAHRGDGLGALLKNTLSEEEQQEYLKPKSYSRDFISLYLSYEYIVNEIESRTYIHIGYAHKMIPSKLGRIFYGTGFEAKYPCKYIVPYYSQDVTWNEDNDSVDYSYQFGTYILPDENNLFTVRVAMIGFVGYDRRGQLTDNKIKRFGLGLFIQ